MKRIDEPNISVVEVLKIFREETSRKADISDIDSTLKVLEEREMSYKSKVIDNTLYEIPRLLTVSARVDKVKMIRYYDYRMRKKPNGRIVYDQIVLSAPNNICPYCTVKTVKTIDHFLPKSEYPSYSITPINLVPSCNDCNLDKKISYPTSELNQTFHPYFDQVDAECWMRAELAQGDPLSIQFSAIQPLNWDDIKFERAKSHMIAYNINQLFSNEANRELRGMQKRFGELYTKDVRLLRDHLQGTYASCLQGLGIMDWRTLMYQELCSNNWFLNGCEGANFFN